ncbi:hypothetical protein D3C83_181140 [compost metagenome]
MAPRADPVFATSAMSKVGTMAPPRASRNSFGVEDWAVRTGGRVRVPIPARIRSDFMTASP